MSRIARSGCVVERHGRKIVRFDSGVGPACGAVEGDTCPCSLLSRSASGLRRRGAEIDPKALGIDAPGGGRLEVSVSAGGVTRVAAVLFALPVAALLTAAWAGGTLAGAIGLDVDVAAAVAGLAALGLACGLAVRSGSALLRMLELNARREQDET